MLGLRITPIVLFISVNIVLRYLSKFNLEAVVGRCSSKQVFLVFFFFFKSHLKTSELESRFINIADLINFYYRTNLVAASAHLRSNLNVYDRQFV